MSVLSGPLMVGHKKKGEEKLKHVEGGSEKGAKGSQKGAAR